MYRANTKILKECGPCPVFAGYTLAFVLQAVEKARENLSQGSEECQLAG